jgi:hypothetical protein
MPHTISSGTSDTSGGCRSQAPPWRWGGPGRALLEGSSQLPADQVHIEEASVCTRAGAPQVACPAGFWGVESAWRTAKLPQHDAQLHHARPAQISNAVVVSTRPPYLDAACVAAVQQQQDEQKQQPLLRQADQQREFSAGATSTSSRHGWGTISGAGLLLFRLVRLGAARLVGGSDGRGAAVGDRSGVSDVRVFPRLVGNEASLKLLVRRGWSGGLLSCESGANAVLPPLTAAVCIFMLFPPRIHPPLCRPSNPYPAPRLGQPPRAASPTADGGAAGRGASAPACGPALVWFRNDLRLEDHAALSAANAAATAVVPVFCFDPREHGQVGSCERRGASRAIHVGDGVGVLTGGCRLGYGKEQAEQSAPGKGCAQGRPFGAAARGVG